MNFRLFESLREWVNVTRRSKGSKKPSEAVALEGARNPRRGDGRGEGASGEINLCSERLAGQFITKQRSLEAIWLNLIQLTEPHAKHGELTSTRAR